MGRPRKATHLHLVQGTARPSRMPKAEPQPDGDARKPKYLKGRASKLWDEFEVALRDMGTLTEVDAPNFAAWCTLTAEFEKRGAEMNAAQIAQMRLLGESLGMSASARAKIGSTSKQKQKDPAARFLA